MSYGDLSAKYFGGNNQGVVDRLFAANPNYDWSNAIDQSVQAYGWGNDLGGIGDTNRTSPNSIVQGILRMAQQIDPNSNVSPDLVQRTIAQSNQDSSNIQREQGSHGGGGFGDLGSLALMAGLAGTGFGMAGMGPMAGLFGGAEGMGAGALDAFAGDFSGAGWGSGAELAGTGSGAGGAMDMFGSMNPSGVGGIYDGTIAGGQGGAMDMFGTGASGAQGNTNGFLDWLSNSAKQMSSPIGGNPFGVTGKDLGTGVMNYILQGNLAKNAKSGGVAAADRGDAMLQPGRASFQQMAQSMVNNPESYFQNNPFAQALTSQYKNNVIPANIAKSGNTGFETDKAGAAFTTALSGNYNQLLQELQGFGGYNQSPSYSGSYIGAGNTQANNFTNESYRGLGKIADSIFGNPTQPKTPQSNPITGSTTLVN